MCQGAPFPGKVGFMSGEITNRFPLELWERVVVAEIRVDHESARAAIQHVHQARPLTHPGWR